MKDLTDLYRDHGDERLPPGQRETTAFPVLSKGETPAVDRDEWSLAVSGAVESSRTFSFESFSELGAETQRQDFHCVTGWSRFDCTFTGISFPTLAEAVDVSEEATHVLFSASDGYTTDLPLADCMHEGVLFAWEFDGDPLPDPHGGPVRVVTPHKYAYKGAKWVDGVEFLTEPELGFWEKRGYSETADPWREERYS
ncbi:sulfite oxidase-like oxidoreductase [Halovivax gelatinilyticus]|uniref:sulfite oxidase-like oxidoreductase n=1 Tax=Halovivax gelatinilyticus TaxID=2961597 RepID=UPI0020CA6F23|nr:sulfite oxidase-like oxidoreductase [Halovivax gelatinilyticus]